MTYVQVRSATAWSSPMANKILSMKAKMAATGMNSSAMSNLPLFKKMPPISRFLTLVVYVTNYSTARQTAYINGPVHMFTTASPVPTAAILSSLNSVYSAVDLSSCSW